MNKIRAEIMPTKKKRFNRDPMQNNNSQQREPKPTRFSHCTPLNTPNYRVLEELLQADFIPPLKKSQNPPNADINKYCKYHRNNDNTMDEYAMITYKLEELIQVGHIRWFVRRDDEGSSHFGYRRFRDQREG